MPIYLAHAGHWIAGLLYLAPVLVLALGIAWQRVADRKKDGEKPNPDDRTAG